MKEYSVRYLFSPKSILRLCLILVASCASFPAVSEAARCGGGTYTTMVLSYAYSPPRWVTRVDPPAGAGLKVTTFKLSLSYVPTQMAFDPSGTVTKVPFNFTSPPSDNLNGLVNFSGMTSNLSLTSFKDVDIFESTFTPTSLNALATVFAENFDGVVAPALPPGWTTTSAGAGTPWFTSTMAPNSPLNDAAAAANPNVGEGQLLSPSFSVPAGGARLTFKNRFDTEAMHDGLVLEISINGINGGAFADIVAAGGTFVSGGYTSLIIIGSGNPIAGRNAWTGNSGGWINTAVNLPAAASGRVAQLRWRLGTDDSPGPGPGATLDDISIDQPQPSFTVFADPMANDYLEAMDPNNLVNHFNAGQIAPTTRVFTVGVLPHMWDPDGLYDNGMIGGSGDWNTNSNFWDDMPFPRPPPLSSDTHWDNTTHANDFAVFGGDPGTTGTVAVVGTISVGGFQFDVSGYDIQGGNLVFPMSVPTSTKIETNANTDMISSPISGGAFTKVGTGTLILTGNNTYTGTTTINAGTLLLNNAVGSGTGNSAVMINSGGIVGGTGLIVGGSIDVLSGGALQGGDGTGPGGALTIAADVTFGSSSIIKLALEPSGMHSTLSRVAGVWAFQTDQGFTFINLGAQPVVYDNIITGLDSNPGVGSWHINNPGFSGIFSYDGAGNIDLNITVVPQPIQVLSAVSRKTHGAFGSFDINLPLSGQPGIECRSGQGAGGTDHQMVVTFASAVTVDSVSVTSGTGAVAGSPIVAGSVVTINLTGVANAQTIVVTLANVNDGGASGDVVVPMSMLKGDTSGNGTVSSSDVSQTKSRTGASLTSGNFRSDVGANGSINGSDVSLVKLFTGTALPPKPAK